MALARQRACGGTLTPTLLDRRLALDSTAASTRPRIRRTLVVFFARFFRRSFLGDLAERIGLGHSVIGRRRHTLVDGRRFFDSLDALDRLNLLFF